MKQIHTGLPNALAHFVRPSALVTLLIGTTIAAISPFDRAFAAVTHGSALARVCLLVTLGLIGIYCSNQNGFVLRKPGAHPVIAGVVCALGVAVYVALIDAWLFRPVVPRSYIEFFHTMILVNGCSTTCCAHLTKMCFIVCSRSQRSGISWRK